MLQMQTCNKTCEYALMGVKSYNVYAPVPNVIFFTSVIYELFVPGKRDLMQNNQVLHSRIGSWP
jgi:hypothetical protein